MTHRRPRVRSSRRVPPLTDEDIDHEIDLVDHDNSTNSGDTESSSARTNRSTQSTRNANQSASTQSLARSESQAPLTQHASESGKLSNDDEPEAGPSQVPRIDEQPRDDDVQSPSQEGNSGMVPSTNPQKRPGRLSTGSRGSESHPTRMKEPESEIDVLYENQRGGFLCGIPLFSSAALGNLDPPAGPTLPTNLARPIYIQPKFRIRAGNGPGPNGV
ncbi:hypothetical protein NUW58_g7759 [Xylaria curta]|uniref:Uncharacterized protein n=1 Tax=Xylaria curta TaxID=42375 RepID=A0ACC1NGR3_9PEZI|nr:hypothetical protein NUW58_g7759 [Xylaria curta]